MSVDLIFHFNKIYFIIIIFVFWFSAILIILKLVTLKKKKTILEITRSFITVVSKYFMIVMIDENIIYFFIKNVY